MTQDSLVWSTRTVEEKGIVLPWQRIEPYGPFQMADGRWTDNPPKGTVLESGEVFIPYSSLWDVAERTIDDYLAERMPPNVNSHEQMALEQAGLADRETRGGCHGTQKLRDFLGMSDDD